MGVSAFLLSTALPALIMRQVWARVSVDCVQPVTVLEALCIAGHVQGPVGSNGARGWGSPTIQIAIPFHVELPSPAGVTESHGKTAPAL